MLTGAHSRSIHTQDENFGGYRLARDLFIEDRAEAHVLEIPAMDTSAAVGKTLGRVAHLAASRRNQLFDLGNRTTEPEHDRFAFASDDGIFHAVDVPRSIDEPLKVSRINATPISAPDDPVEGPCMGCLLYTSPSPRDQRGSRMPSSA